MNRFGILILAGLLVVVAGSEVKAEVVYSYSLNAPSYEVQPGESIDVAVYIQETAIAPDVSLIASDNGLGTTGFRLEQAGSSLGDPATITGAALNPEFNDPSNVLPVVTAGTVSLYETVDLMGTAGVMGADLGSGIRRVFLGTVRFTGSATVGEETTFDVSTRGAAADTSTFNSTIPLDGPPPAPGIGSTTITIRVVPEPATLSLLALGSLALIRRKRI